MTISLFDRVEKVFKVKIHSRAGAIQWVLARGGNVVGWADFREVIESTQDAVGAVSMLDETFKAAIKVSKATMHVESKKQVPFIVFARFKDGDYFAPLTNMREVPIVRNEVKIPNRLFRRF